MTSIRQHLRLHNGHQPCRLADGCVLGQTISIGCNGGCRGEHLALNVDDSTPLGKAGACCVVLLAPRLEAVQALTEQVDQKVMYEPQQPETTAIGI